MSADLDAMFPTPAPLVWDDLQQQAIEACCDVNKRIVASLVRQAQVRHVLIER